MLTLSFTITELEFLDYYHYMCWARPEKRSRRWLYFIIIPIAASLLLYGALGGGFDENQSSRNLILVAAASAIGLFFLMPSWVKSISHSTARKSLAQSAPDSILTHYELAVSEEGIIGKTRVKEVKFLWAAFNNKVVVNDCYYLFLNINQALVIPIRAFTSAQEKEAFDTHLTRYLPDQAGPPVQQ